MPGITPSIHHFTGDTDIALQGKEIHIKNWKRRDKTVHICS